MDRAFGRPLTGGTSFIVNKPDPSIGQIARINCQYGVKATPGPLPKPSGIPKSTAATAPTPVPQVEVSVSEYASAKQATGRISATSDEWRAHSAVAHMVKVGSHPATVLIGYGPPLLVLATGTHTIAVNVLASATPSGKLDSVLNAIAQAALQGVHG